LEYVEEKDFISVSERERESVNALEEDLVSERELLFVRETVFSVEGVNDADSCKLRVQLGDRVEVFRSDEKVSERVRLGVDDGETDSDLDREFESEPLTDRDAVASVAVEYERDISFVNEGETENETVSVDVSDRVDVRETLPSVDAEAVEDDSPLCETLTDGGGLLVLGITEMDPEVLMLRETDTRSESDLIE